jgi:hypothetical protein
MKVTTNASGELEIVSQIHSQEEKDSLLAEVSSSAVIERSQHLQQQQPLLSVRHLTKEFPMRSGTVWEENRIQSGR